MFLASTCSHYVRGLRGTRGRRWRWQRRSTDTRSGTTHEWVLRNQPCVISSNSCGVPSLTVCRPTKIVIANCVFLLCSLCLMSVCCRFQATQTFHFLRTASAWSITDEKQRQKTQRKRKRVNGEHQRRMQKKKKNNVRKYVLKNKKCWLTFARSLSPSWPADKVWARHRHNVGEICSRTSGSRNPEKK